MLSNNTGPIVYIDDDEDEVYIIKKALQDLSIFNPLRFFSDPFKALEYLSTTEEQSLVILCDMFMRPLNGIEVRQHIEADDYLRLKSIPFIFLTDSVNADDIKRVYKGNIQGYYQKPYEFEVYKENIDLIIRYWQKSLHPNNIA
ncbi:response regulator [Tellurirhabdus rosea]|uniref:response regulator n=1 Tax=Tellurirhabdus rosea TaxID=2674997 RepID=UPI00224D7426|nr:response regulator [Tellurirhabdus rosea]